MPDACRGMGVRTVRGWEDHRTGRHPPGRGISKALGETRDPGVDEPVSPEITQALQSWAQHHKTFLAWLSIGSVFTFLATLVAIPLMIVRMPSDYFLFDRKGLRSYRRAHPLWSFVTVILKNVLGVVFIACGIVMLFLPGQGVLTILVGLTLVSFPKKRAVEIAIARKEGVMRAMNWIRQKASRDPLMLPGVSSQREGGRQQVEDE